MLREAYLKRFGSEPGSARKPDQYRLEQEEESDSSLDELEEKFGQDLAITPAVEAELKRDERVLDNFVIPRNVRERSVERMSARKRNVKEKSSKGSSVREENLKGGRKRLIQRRLMSGRGQRQGHLPLQHNLQRHLIGSMLQMEA